MKLDAPISPDNAHPPAREQRSVAPPGPGVQQRMMSLLLFAACSLALWSVMDGWTWSLGRITSTGCEEEALFPIWKFAKGQTVYADAHAVPFSVSYYNWLFFSVYGGAARIFNALFQFKDSDLPALARFVTLGFAFASIGILYALLGKLKLAGLTSSRLFRLTVSIFLVINPLTGSWLFTARPDIAAITCELAGLWWALRYSTTRKMMDLLGAVLAGCIAWSFKQNFVHLLGGLCVLLMLRRDWRALGCVVLTTLALVASTLLIGGEGFRHALIGGQLNCPVSAESAWSFFQKACGTAPQLVVIAAGLGLAFLCWKRRTASDETDLLASIGIVALGIGFLGASKQGADINYFIPVSIFGMLWGICHFRAGQAEPVKAGGMVNMVRWAMAALFGLGILSGLIPQGKKAFRQIAGLFITPVAARENGPAIGVNDQIVLLKRHLEELPAPVFVTDRACNLPWIQGKAPHFVYSYMYPLDKKAGANFAQGGIGGLIEQGYFETVVVLERGCACESAAFAKVPCPHVAMNHLPVMKDGDVPSLDGGRMHQYRLAFRDGWFTYYLKRTP